MNPRYQQIHRYSLTTLVLGLALLSSTRQIWAGETCPSNPSGPDICVAFDGDTPEINTDFRVDYAADPVNPSVELITGDLSWNVRSDDNGSPGNIGAITIDPVSSSDNFNIRIANGTNPGAANVGSIVLGEIISP